MSTPQKEFVPQWAQICAAVALTVAGSAASMSYTSGRLAEKVDAHAAEIASIKVEVASVKTDVGSVKDKVAGVDSKVAGVAGQLETIVKLLLPRDNRQTVQYGWTDATTAKNP